MHMDLNADVGEECGDDALLIPLLTSASVACGGHAGDAAVMRRTLELCLKHGVTAGAHVSYPDREGFGRRELKLAGAEIASAVLDQLRALSAVARAVGVPLRYLKAHGALYNRMADDAEAADAVLQSLAQFNPKLVLLTLPGSLAADRARLQGVTTVGEAFADRGYRDDGRLMPRDEPGALITDAETVSARALRLALEGVIPAASGRDIRLDARSLCVHGDTPGAVLLARAVRASLMEAGVELGAFA